MINLMNLWMMEQLYVKLFINLSSRERIEIIQASKKKKITLVEVYFQVELSSLILSTDKSRLSHLHLNNLMMK